MLARVVPTTTDELNRLLRAAGFAVLGSYIVLIPLSPGIAAVSPFGFHQIREAAFFRALIADGRAPWPPAAAFLSRAISGESALEAVGVRTAAYVGLLSVATLGAVFATVLLGYARHLIATSTRSLIFRMAVAFGIANALIYPMFTQDMWMSIVWGRMLQAGHNPYYEFFTPAALAGGPLENSRTLMMYGPLWAWVSAGVAAMGGTSELRAFVSSKLLLLGCWVWALWLIQATLADEPPARQASALCLFGWWPASVYFAVGAGHNDVAMMCLVLLWMYLVQARAGRHEGRILSVVALVASVLIKYVSAPLLFVELWQGWTANSASRWKYIAGVACTMVGGLLLTATLWHGVRFLQFDVEMQGWHFLTPAHAASALLNKIGVPVGLSLATVIARVVFGAVALYYFILYTRRPGPDSFFQLVLAIMSAVMFTGVGHVWPWFLIWILAPAALAGKGPLWRLALATAVCGPFLNIFWLATRGWPDLALTGVVFYAAVAVVAACPLGWRRFEWGARGLERL